MLNEAPKRCPSSPLYDPDLSGQRFEPFTTERSTDSDITLLIAICAAIAGLIVVFMLIRLVLQILVRRRHRWLLTTLSKEQVFRIYKQQQREHDEQSLLDRTTDSMFQEEEIPMWVRYLVPFILVANVGFFLSGHLNLGATIKIVATLAGQDLTIESFFEFSIAKSTVDLWNAGGKALAVLIVLFAGVWPYVRQIITFVLWFLPPIRVSVARRGYIFVLLDTLAKWSTVDIFVLILSLVSFRLSILSPREEFLPEDFYSVELFVVPLWGLYANLIAQFLSQITSHWIIHFHRKVVSSALARSKTQRKKTTDEGEDEVDERSHDDGHEPEADDDDDGDDDDTLHRHAYARPHRGEASGLEVRKGVNHLAGVAGLALLGLVVAGCILPSFSLEFLGVLGVAVEFGQEFQEAIERIGVFQIVELLLNQAHSLGGIGNYIGLTSISIVLVLTVLVVPVVQAGALLVNWFLPMKKRTRRRMEVLVEILQAWQYVEVYIIAVILSAWQLGQVSEFLINSYCNGLDGVFSSLVFYGILRPEDAQCFRVQSTLTSGTYVLVVAALTLLLLDVFVKRAAAHYHYDKAVERRRRTEPQDVRASLAAMMEDGNLEETMTKIHHVPVLFTDTFRWLLQSGGGNASGVVDADESEVPGGLGMGPGPGLESAGSGLESSEHGPEAPRELDRYSDSASGTHGHEVSEGLRSMPSPKSSSVGENTDEGIEVVGEEVEPDDEDPDDEERNVRTPVGRFGEE
mmetsp:Transcript_6362/g.14393  ORF Transcript_6362/g.14393 Transcript_6362/m.14393 type:complete len:744 (-) Transcript_6362:1382-3613(-)